MRSIYLDYNATTPVAPEVREAMLPFLGEEYGNPSSVHAVGARARKALDDAREVVANTLGARPRELIFTSGGTEGVQLAIRGVVTAAALARGRRPVHVITTAVEHSSVLGCLEALEAEGWASSTRVGVDAMGRIDPKAIEAAFRAETVLVSVMAANNETGVLSPLVPLARLCRDRGIPFHSDAVQALGKIPIDLSALPVDLMSLSAHKIYGPKGAGALFVRMGVDLRPVLTGAHEMGRRGGTENVPGIVGFASAMELMARDLEEENARVAELRDLLQDGLVSRIEGVRIHGDTSARVANTLNVSFDGVVDETLLLSMDREGISVSSGSACASGAFRASHVLLAMGVSKGEAKGAIRFSLGRGTSQQDVDYVLEKLPALVGRVRES